ncbi:hypothetical protein [Blastococcus sp. CT_GayMR16]|uniref:hypothetical protein n=1 Tax=Blastococcus sp. CT_GayMR16 TaxID=2559607 RepID=UPI00107355CD|nr:hypothetical protein [Blastococcus sp. CT_GayMR16]TFV90414.1 hypothetical protein E4P38_02950 [Blastococcus sp. CT_GayMR16]
MTTGSGSAGTAGEGFRAVPDPITWTTTGGDVVTVWEARPGDWRWHVTATNHEVGDHGEGHTRKEGAVEAALRHHPHVDDGREGQ